MWSPRSTRRKTSPWRGLPATWLRYWPLSSPLMIREYGWPATFLVCSPSGRAGAFVAAASLPAKLCPVLAAVLAVAVAVLALSVAAVAAWIAWLIGPVVGPPRRFLSAPQALRIPFPRTRAQVLRVAADHGADATL